MPTERAILSYLLKQQSSLHAESSRHLRRQVQIDVSPRPQVQSLSIMSKPRSEIWLWISILNWNLYSIVRVDHEYTTDTKRVKDSYPESVSCSPVGYRFEQRKLKAKDKWTVVFGSAMRLDLDIVSNWAVVSPMTSIALTNTNIITKSVFPRFNQNKVRPSNRTIRFLFQLAFHRAVACQKTKSTKMIWQSRTTCYMQRNETGKCVQQCVNCRKMRTE